MLVEIAGDQLYFQTIARGGQTIDHGVLARQAKPSRSALQLSHWPALRKHLAASQGLSLAHEVRTPPPVMIDERRPG
jgi:hypothetical protein